jgi:hypothetical protein
MDDGAELPGQLDVEVVTQAIRLGVVDDTDGSLKPRLR